MLGAGSILAGAFIGAGIGALSTTAMKEGEEISTGNVRSAGERLAYAVFDDSMSWDEKWAYAFEPGQMVADFVTGVVIGEILDGIMAATQNKLRSIFANYDATMREAIESGSSSIVEIVDEEKGTFIIKDWSDYPDDYVPVPDQNKVWTFLEGDEYNSARDSANIFNRNMRAADPYYANNGLEIHEIEPVKMGGSPTDINNKTAIQSQVHRRYVTPWWSKIKKGLN